MPKHHDSQAAGLFAIPPDLDPANPADRARIVIHTSGTLSDLLAQHLCHNHPPDLSPLDPGTAQAMIAAQIRSFLVFIAIGRYQQSSVGNPWAGSVVEQLQGLFPTVWDSDIHPFVAGIRKSYPQLGDSIADKLRDPFAPYQGASVVHMEADLLGSPFGRLLRLVIPAFYSEAQHTAAGKALLDLAARGTRAFLADICNA